MKISNITKQLCCATAQQHQLHGSFPSILPNAWMKLKKVNTSKRLATDWILVVRWENISKCESVMSQPLQMAMSCNHHKGNISNIQVCHVHNNIILFLKENVLDSSLLLIHCHSVHWCLTCQDPGHYKQDIMESVTFYLKLFPFMGFVGEWSHVLAKLNHRVNYIYETYSL